MASSLSFKQQGLLQQAVGLHQNGQVAEAADIYRKLLRAAPSNAQVLCFLGNAEYQSGNAEEGARLLGKSLLLAPGIANTWFNRGTMLMDMDRVEEAWTCYEKAIALKPDFVEALINGGTALQALGRSGEALEGYDKVLASHPGYVQAWNDRGGALKTLGRPDEALISFERALALQPDYEVAHYNRGCVLKELGRLDEAVVAFDAALRIDSAYVEAHENRGNVLRDLGRLEEALASYEKTLVLDPGIEWIAGEIQHIRMDLCDWTDFEARLEALQTCVAGGVQAIDPFQFHALSDSPALLLRAAEIFSAAMFPPLPSQPRPVSNGQRIRVAYVSSDFKEHPVARHIVAVLEHHDRSKFEIFALSTGAPTDNALRRRIEDGVDHFIDVHEKSDAEVCRLGADLGIDIAVDLNGFTAGRRTGVFAGRLAPLQVSYIGFLGSMGAPYIDYLVADEVIIPADRREFYSEKIVSLPSFQANDDKPPLGGRVFSRQDAGLPEAGFVFCCFNRSYKITPETFALWMRILGRAPGSVLWLFDDNPTAANNLRKEAEKRGVSAERLVFAEGVSMADHFSRQALADLFLDTSPYNAGATASAALRVGLPVLTRTGESFAARMGTSLLNAAGLPELAVDSVEAYEAVAVQLATEPERLAAIRRKLEGNLPGCALFDASAFTRNLEAAYGVMHQRQQDGLPPDHIGIA